MDQHGVRVDLDVVVLFEVNGALEQVCMTSPVAGDVLQGPARHAHGLG